MFNCSNQVTGHGDTGSSHVVFRQLQNQRDGHTQHGPFTDATKLAEWATSLCVTAVRELTFDNAEVHFICSIQHQSRIQCNFATRNNNHCCVTGDDGGWSTFLYTLLQAG